MMMVLVTHAIGFAREDLSLRRCKMRYRVPYQTRHTYATLALHLAGARPGYVARQLGHANTGMLFKVYSKWIDGADNQRERAKLDAAFVHDLCTARGTIQQLLDTAN
jgi:integrase